MRSRSVVLDIGCGSCSGIYDPNEFIYLPCDIEEINVPNFVRIVISKDGFKIPISESCVDTVICHMSLHHFDTDTPKILAESNVELMMKEIRRVLKPNGILSITEPNCDINNVHYLTMDHILSDIIESKLCRIYKFWSTSEVLSMICSCGFVLKSITESKTDRGFEDTITCIFSLDTSAQFEFIPGNYFKPEKPITLDMMFNWFKSKASRKHKTKLLLRAMEKIDEKHGQNIEMVALARESVLSLI